MNYYFEIQTSKASSSGTNSDFTFTYFGEKGQASSFTLWQAIGKKRLIQENYLVLL